MKKTKPKRLWYVRLDTGSIYYDTITTDKKVAKLKIEKKFLEDFDLGFKTVKDWSDHFGVGCHTLEEYYGFECRLLEVEKVYFDGNDETDYFGKEL